MALNSMGLGFVFTARDFASAKFARLERRFASLDERVTGGTARMTSAFQQLGVGIAVFASGAVAVAGALSLANAAGRFEQGLAAVGAVTRATTRELGMLRDAAIQAGIATQFSPEEAVSGLQSLATAGQTAEQATRTLVPVLDLAAGSLGQLGVAEAAEAVVGTLNAYGFAAEEASGVTDKLLRITQLTNFQTRDFEVGLAKAAATGAVFSQNLDDVLITMGLLRNRNIDASSSATAFRESVRRVGAESRAQQAITGAGVKVFDAQSGRMRSIVDIMGDFARATTTMSEEERNRRVATAFGARGLLAFNAVLNASFTTMRDGQQVTLRGVEAIAALRNEMTGAGGTAARFREQLLDTFEGQKTLLKGTLQTFAVVLGEPFAAVFKPIVRAVVDALNALLRAFQVVPASIKRIFAGIMLAAGSFLMLIGGVIAAKVAIAFLAIALKTLAVMLGGLLATLLPVVLSVAALGAVVAGFVVAFRRNVGGVADFVQRIGERVRLFFNGLKQLFGQGGFSGAVREELNRAENQVIKRFVISLYKAVHRIRQIWTGFKEAFSRTIEEARPVFEDLMNALSGLGREIGALFSGVTGIASGLPSSAFRSFGQVAGYAIAAVVRRLVELVAGVVQVVTAVIWMANTVKDMFLATGTWIGETVAQVYMWLTDTLPGAISNAVAHVVGFFHALKRALSPVVEFFRGIGRAIQSVVDGILDAVIRMLRQVPDALLPSSLERMKRLPLSSSSEVRTEAGFDAVGRTDATASRAEAATSSMPAAADAAGRTRDFAQLEAHVMALTRAQAQRPSQTPPFQINVQVDGETVARASHNAHRDVAARSFSPVPAY